MNWSNWVDLETVLTEWNEQKNVNLFKMMGNELIVRRPYTYKYNLKGLAREIDMAHDEQEYRDFISWWTWGIKHKSGINFEIVDPEAGSFNYYSKFSYIEPAFSSTVLAGNAYDGPEFKVKFEDGTIFKVATGMKPMKIIHKFVEKYGTPREEEMFERFRIWHSKFLNQKTVDGELCLSIHPLDYMTMSDNANNWSSCMRWTDRYGNAGDPGDYRAGTIDCMNSPYIIIGYLHNPKHKFTLNNGWEWNSKRWRELFIVNEGSITEIKGYPYQDENLTNTCLMWIKELAEKNLDWTYEDEEFNARNEIQLDDKTIYLDYVKSPYMYKDIGTLDKHSCRLNKKYVLAHAKTYNDYWNSNYSNGNTSYFLNIPYGGVPTCMCCGAVRSEDQAERSVMCINCDSVTICGCCGNLIYSNEDTYWIDDSDEPICCNCWEDNTIMDTLTEESHFINNSTEIWLLLGYDRYKEPVWYRGDNIWVYEPENNREYQKLFSEMPRSMWDGWRTRYYVTLDMVYVKHYQEVLNIFDITSDADLYDDELYYDINMNCIYEEDDDT